MAYYARQIWPVRIGIIELQYLFLRLIMFCIYLFMYQYCRGVVVHFDFSDPVQIFFIADMKRDKNDITLFYICSTFMVLIIKIFCVKVDCYFLVNVVFNIDVH